MAPALLLLGIFTFYPIMCGVTLAFTDFSLLRSHPDGTLVWPQYVGLANFRRLLSDSYFWLALQHSVTYLLVVPVLQLASIVVAVALNCTRPGVRLFRTALYLPVVTSVVVVGITWKWLLRSDGLLNNLLGYLGLPTAAWLTDANWALAAVMLVTFWQGLGYYMIIYLAGLQAITPEYSEAAVIDGASTVDVFRYITLPLLKPSIALCTLLSCISALKVFSEIYIMTKGGPQNGTLTMAYYIYDRAFENFEMGYSAAVALVLALVVGALSWIHFKIFEDGGWSSY